MRVGGEDLLNKGSQWSKNHGEGNDPKLLTPSLVPAMEPHDRVFFNKIYKFKIYNFS